ncbi:MAG TPA: lanthionine synthetase LanC family protein, partial [Chitinophaga sp.]
PPDAQTKAQEFPGFFQGAAGVAYFLLAYVKFSGDEATLKVVKKTLARLMEDFRMKGATFVKDPTAPMELDFGVTGIALTFIKAYEVLGEATYKDFATQVLRHFPRRYRRNKLNTAWGISGLGEVYIEAYRVFGDEEWLQRADYIAQTLLALTVHSRDGGQGWFTDTDRGSTADLMLGISGVVHFLMRYLYPQKLGFPMLSV